MTAPKRYRFARGDALHLLPTLDDDSVDALITDPPYSSGGMYRGDRARGTVQKYIQHAQRKLYAAFAGDGRDQRGYFHWTTLWLSLALPKIRPRGFALIFTDWRQLPVTTDALQAAGFNWRGLIGWNKTAGARAPHKGYFRHQLEYVVWGTRGGIDQTNPAGPLPGVYTYASHGRQKTHLAGKPPGLMADLVKCCPPGAHILDPFAGSATTLLAALDAGHTATGFELDPPTFAAAHARLASHRRPSHHRAAA